MDFPPVGARLNSDRNKNTLLSSIRNRDGSSRHCSEAGSMGGTFFLSDGAKKEVRLFGVDQIESKRLHKKSHPRRVMMQMHAVWSILLHQKKRKGKLQDARKTPYKMDGIRYEGEPCTRAFCRTGRTGQEK